MKKYLFILILLIGKAYGQKFTNTDTLCFPVAVIQKVLIAAEQKKVLEQQVSILNSRISQKDSIINLLQSKDTTNNSIITTYQNEIKTMKDQRAILENSISYFEKQVKKERLKKKLSMLGGIVTTGIMTYLFLTK